MKLPRELEKDIQESATALLALNHIGVIAFAASGTHTRLRGALPSGLPDLLVVDKGRYVWVELKRDSGVVSMHQRIMHDWLREHGASVYTCHSVDEMLTALRLEGIVVRTAAP